VEAAGLPVYTVCSFAATDSGAPQQDETPA